MFAWLFLKRKSSYCLHLGVVRVCVVGVDVIFGVFVVLVVPQRQQYWPWPSIWWRNLLRLTQAVPFYSDRQVTFDNVLLKKTLISIIAFFDSFKSNLHTLFRRTTSAPLCMKTVVLNPQMTLTLVAVSSKNLSCWP